MMKIENINTKEGKEAEAAYKKRITYSWRKCGCCIPVGDRCKSHKRVRYVKS